MKTPEEFVLSFLIDLLDPKNQNPDMSICDFVQHCVFQNMKPADSDYPCSTEKCKPVTRATIKNAVKGWDNYSGESVFPVASTKVDLSHPRATEHAITQFCDCENYWADEYGERRLELLHRMVSSLTLEVACRSNT